MRQGVGRIADSDLHCNGANISKKKKREVMAEDRLQRSSSPLAALSAAPRSRSLAAARRVAPTEAMVVEKPLQNGDLYIGSFSGNVPYGIGKYLWSDGCMYEGEWRRGEASGHGKFSWPSGATYEGQFRSGRMEGFGVFSGSDGEIYRGHWSADRKHGFGKKCYANGDWYEGNWKRNLQEGRGKYVWKNGNQYVGEWRDGVISGRGILKGDHLPNPNSSQLFLSSASLEHRFSLEKNLPRICIWESDDEAGEITCDIVDALEASMLYKDASYVEKIGAESEGRTEMKSQLQATVVEAKKPGQTISKGHKNYDLMLNLQLGIRYSVGKLSSSIKLRELRSGDFDPREKFWTRFPPEGSKITPPHQTAEFKWKDYCPMVFRHLRNLFSVDPADYMLAICGDDALRELSSPGKSGSFFYLTQDDRFMIKTVKKSEVKVLIRMLRSYYQHVNRFKNSLVTKFYGVHCVKSIGGQKVRFIVIGNLFCSEHRIHRRFDLKGSSYGRITDKTLGEIDETTTLKDLDLNFVFRLQRSLLQELLEQIDRDCKFLEAEGIMDYSLLVGLHFRDDNSSPSPANPSSNTDPTSRNHSYIRSRTSDRRQSIRLGWSMAGKAVDQTSGEIREAALYFGIIDVLQDYDIGKKLEHAYKSLQVDPQSISAVDPKLYSRRFRRFLRRTFVQDAD